jgi:miniconductance mechanosensitive channel
LLKNRLSNLLTPIVDSESGLGVVIIFVIMTALALLLAILVDRIAIAVVNRIVKKIVFKTPTKKDEMLYERKVFHWIAHYIPIIILYLFSFSYEDLGKIIRHILVFIGISITVIALYKLLDAINDIYNLKPYAKDMPIKGLLQVIKIIVLVFALVIGLVNFSNSGSALALLSSIGGMSAVLILVFRDSILGLVAGIQLSTNNLLSIGDWIEMPQFRANGEVIDVSLTKVSVANWDKTITHIPAYKFIEESFINWEGMSKSGARRISRQIVLDGGCVGFLEADQIENLKKVRLLRTYLEEKEREVLEHNTNVQDTHPLNQRGLTNIGTLRIYIREYLKMHPSISKDFIVMVRQLESTGQGIPLQIYCFCNDIRWNSYEEIQANIFEHIFSVLPYFGLSLFQVPTGQDFAKIHK